MIQTAFYHSTCKEENMSDLKQRFAQAQEDVVSLAERPDNATLLKLYPFYNKPPTAT